IWQNCPPPVQPVPGSGPVPDNAWYVVAIGVDCLTENAGSAAQMPQSFLFLFGRSRASHALREEGEWPAVGSEMESGSPVPSGYFANAQPTATPRMRILS